LKDEIRGFAECYIVGNFLIQLGKNMSARPLVTVQKEGKTVPLPKVFSSALRYDLVRFVHNNIAKNRRIPYAVTRRAGHQTSAESWGTGRAVARIPRVSGGGTHRSGQGAFGNMCRGGRMFAPTKVFRKWHSRVPRKVRRLAVRAALAASAIPALVMARGHNLEDVPEIPLVVPNSVEALEKTKDAVKLLKDIGAYHDVQKVMANRTVRPGKGKWRNRRYIIRKGPLLVVSKPCEALKAFRNLAGLDINFVSSLNILRLAPGGHLGRLIIWTEDAFNRLDECLKCDSIVGLPDSKRIINSEEVQGVLRSKNLKGSQRKPHRNKRRARLNPAAKTESKVQTKLYLKRCKVNADPKLRRAKAKNKLAQIRLWYKKVMGKADKKGEKRTSHRTPRTSAKSVKRSAKRAEKRSQEPQPSKAKKLSKRNKK